MSPALPADTALWPEEIRSAYEERAAILEFDAKLPRHLAERKARALAHLALLKKGPDDQAEA